jgi:molybdopterin synthase catalytic subunit/molybdopterin converting factor small subunit
MQVRVELFGRLASQSGEREVSLELAAGATLLDAAAALASRFPVLDWVPAVCRPARNLEYAAWSDVAEDGDELSFIPPVSGGADDDPRIFVLLTDEALDPAPLVWFAEGPEMGAVVTFSGNVRDHNRGRQVGHLEYEGYRPMAEREMRKIAAQALERWPGRIAIAHRLGRLGIGEASVLVVAACGHRGEAFDCCRYAIDTLKERVPIWKREVWSDGEVWIEGPSDASVAPE